MEESEKLTEEDEVVPMAPPAKRQKTGNRANGALSANETLTRVMAIRSTRIMSVEWNRKELGHHTELDSHADTCVVGDDTALILQDYERPVRVHGYNDKVAEAKNCKTVSGAIAYDHPETGDVYMLVIHQAILIPSMKANLLCPMQLRDNGVFVNDEPKFMAPNPTDDHNAIVVHDDQGDVHLRIPFAIKGATTYFPSRVPTRMEYEQTPLDHVIDLTRPGPGMGPLKRLSLQVKRPLCWIQLVFAREAADRKASGYSLH
jgi:hypothetical protein